MSTERPLVLSLNSGNCVKKLEKQNIIAAVTTHWLPLPQYYRDMSACFSHSSSPLCHTEAEDPEKYLMPSQNVCDFRNSLYFSLWPNTNTILMCSEDTNEFDYQIMFRFSCIIIKKNLRIKEHKWHFHSLTGITLLKDWNLSISQRSIELGEDLPTSKQSSDWKMCVWGGVGWGAGVEWNCFASTVLLWLVQWFKWLSRMAAQWTGSG